MNDDLIMARANEVRATLEEILSRQGIHVAEVERPLAAYVHQLKASGQPPERVVMAVKHMLSKRMVSLGQSAERAFQAARENSRLAEALVSLAIVQYFGEPSES